MWQFTPAVHVSNIWLKTVTISSADNKSIHQWNIWARVIAWRNLFSLRKGNMPTREFKFKLSLNSFALFDNCIFSMLFSCDQAALWMVQSFLLPFRLSVTPFWLCSHHRIIMKFSGVITSDRSDVHAKGQGQRSKVKVTEVTTQLYRFPTVTPVCIHIWWWNDAISLIMVRRGALLFFKVIRQISRSHGSKNCRIWPRMGVSGL